MKSVHNFIIIPDGLFESRGWQFWGRFWGKSAFGA